MNQFHGTADIRMIDQQVDINMVITYTVTEPLEVRSRMGSRHVRSWHSETTSDSAIKINSSVKIRLESFTSYIAFNNGVFVKKVWPV